MKQAYLADRVSRGDNTEGFCKPGHSWLQAGCGAAPAFVDLRLCPAFQQRIRDCLQHTGKGKLAQLHQMALINCTCPRLACSMKTWQSDTGDVNYTVSCSAGQYRCARAHAVMHSNAYDFRLWTGYTVAIQDAACPAPCICSTAPQADSIIVPCRKSMRFLRTKDD